MRRTLRALSVIALLFLIAGIGGALVPRPVFDQSSPHNETGGNFRQVMLLSNPIHTDIAFPTDADVVERLSFLQTEGLPTNHPDAGWIVIGWGGRSFYIETPTWADLKPGPVFRALTLDQSAMHFQLAGSIDTDSDQAILLSLTDSGFEAMLDRVELQLRQFEQCPNADIRRLLWADGSVL